MDTVNVNSATQQQLSTLLSITMDQAAAIVSARPVTSGAAFRKLLPPAHFSAQEPALDIPKLNVNAQSVDNLVAITGVSREAAQKVVDNRPYYLMHQVQIVAGDDSYAKLAQYFTIPDLEFRDKLTGQSVSLTTDPSKLLVPKPTEGAPAVTAKSVGAEPLHTGPDMSHYDVFGVPDSEAAVDVVAKLESAYGRKVIPSFQDSHSSRRFLNPQYCVVQFQSGITDQASKKIIADLGVNIEEQHRTPGLYTLRIPQASNDPAAMVAVIAALNAKKEVKFSEPNYMGFDDREAVTKPGLASGGAKEEIAWNLALTNIPAAWKHGTGSPNVVIAIIDSGIDETHPALKDAILPRAAGESWNFSGESGPPADTEGHGTFIAGILAGNGQMGIHGIAPKCRLLPLKISLMGDVSSYAHRRDAILFALNKVAKGSRLVINMSWKTAGDVGLIRDAVDMASARGAILVASAGNLPERENEPHYPSDYPSVIAVAAVGADRKRTDYSYYGDAVDISAPGGDANDPNHNIVSTAPGGKTDKGCGTSFAAPHVAGIAALVASSFAMLTVPQLRFCLENSASPLTEPGMGTGLCDAEAAIGLALGHPDMISGKIPHAESAPAGAVVQILQALNTLDSSGLVTSFGFPVITANLLIARRPIASIAQIQGTLGLSDAIYAALLGASGNTKNA